MLVEDQLWLPRSAVLGDRAAYDIAAFSNANAAFGLVTIDVPGATVTPAQAGRYMITGFIDVGITTPVAGAVLRCSIQPFGGAALTFGELWLAEANPAKTRETYSLFALGRITTPGAQGFKLTINDSNAGIVANVAFGNSDTGIIAVRTGA